MKKVFRRIRQAHDKQAQRKVAVFDIDGTVFRSSLLIELTEALVDAGIFPESARRAYLKSYKNWFDRKGSYEKYLNAVIKAFNKNIRGVSRSDFLKVSLKVISFQRNRTYRYPRELIKELRRENYYILAISNSPREIVDRFCRKWGFDKVYGRVYKTDTKGRFTGSILYEDLISDKEKILKRAIEKEKLTLKQSVGVGDSESDIPFLNRTEKSICFNPNRKLYNYAKRAGWKVVVERKDNIYNLN